MRNFARTKFFFKLDIRTRWSMYVNLANSLFTHATNVWKFWKFAIWTWMYANLAIWTWRKIFNFEDLHFWYWPPECIDYVQKYRWHDDVIRQKRRCTAVSHKFHLFRDLGKRMCIWKWPLNSFRFGQSFKNLCCCCRSHVLWCLQSGLTLNLINLCV